MSQPTQRQGHKPWASAAIDKENATPPPGTLVRQSGTIPSLHNSPAAVQASSDSHDAAASIATADPVRRQPAFWATAQGENVKRCMLRGKRQTLEQRKAKLVDIYDDAAAIAQVRLADRDERARSGTSQIAEASSGPPGYQTADGARTQVAATKEAPYDDIDLLVRLDDRNERLKAQVKGLMEELSKESRLRLDLQHEKRHLQRQVKDFTKELSKETNARKNLQSQVDYLKGQLSEEANARQILQAQVDHLNGQLRAVEELLSVGKNLRLEGSLSEQVEARAATVQAELNEIFGRLAAALEPETKKCNEFLDLEYAKASASAESGPHGERLDTADKHQMADAVLTANEHYLRQVASKVNDEIKRLVHQKEQYKECAQRLVVESEKNRNELSVAQTRVMTLEDKYGEVKAANETLESRLLEKTASEEALQAQVKDLCQDKQRLQDQVTYLTNQSVEKDWLLERRRDQEQCVDFPSDFFVLWRPQAAL